MFGGVEVDGGITEKPPEIFGGCKSEEDWFVEYRVSGPEVGGPIGLSSS